MRVRHQVTMEICASRVTLLRAPTYNRVIGFVSRQGGFMDKLVWRKRVCALVLLSAVMATVSPAQKFTTLVTFSGPNGAQPSGRLEQGFDGNFYGITAQGGAYSCFPADRKSTVLNSSH